MNSYHIQVPGKITPDGVIVAENATVLKRWIENNKDCGIRISLEVFREKRSSKQNRYYWGVVVEMIKNRLEDLGHTLSTEEVHDFLKKEFNYKEINTGDTYFLKIPQSTKDQDTVSFNEYLGKIQMFAAEVLEIAIPDPDPNYSSIFSIK